MQEYQSLSHVRWECKYHIVFVPKYRKKVLYGRTRQRIGRIFHQLCRQKEVGLVEGHAMPDSGHENHLKKVLVNLLNVIKAGEVVSLLWTMEETLD